MLHISTLTTADPTATPPAVAAICLNKLGCCGCPAGATIGGWAGATGAGVRAGGGEAREDAALEGALLKYQTNFKKH